jgi:hypothetical protein
MEILGFWPAQIPYQQLLRWTNVAVLVVFYYACKVVYRLYFSPLSHIPGRKLAGMLFKFLFLHPLKFPIRKSHPPHIRDAMYQTSLTLYTQLQQAFTLATTI